MEEVTLTVKFILFLAMEVFVVAAVGAALILGLYQIVKSRISESRRLDEIFPEATPASITVTHQS